MTEACAVIKAPSRSDAVPLSAIATATVPSDTRGTDFADMPSRRSPMATPPLSGWPARGLTLGAIVYVRLTSPRVGSDVDLAPALTSRQLRYGVSAYYGRHKSAATQPCFRPDDVDAEVVVYRSHGELEASSRFSRVVLASAATRHVSRDSQFECWFGSARPQQAQRRRRGARCRNR